LNTRISNGVVHRLPNDLKVIILKSDDVFRVWEDITPLARNEWICWIQSAKKNETRERRIGIMLENLLSGKRRPCCWARCGHRGGN
jgi:uncharacterized protein YdeI (YjbR/CyaY-like superfamily)